MRRDAPTPQVDDAPRSPPAGAEPPPSQRVSFGEAARVWARIGLLSFGGPAGQIALMHKELVERRRWIDEGRFLHALNYCMLLPGPEAQQLATYIGWLMHRTRGGLAAGVLFVLPGSLAVLALSLLYVAFRGVPLVAAVLFGVKAAVLAIVVEAVLRVAKRALKSRLMYGVAALSFLGVSFFSVPFPIVVVSALLLGVCGSRMAPSAFPRPSSVGAGDGQGTVIERMAAAGELSHTAPSATRAVRVLLVCGALWALPFLVLPLVFGPGSVFTQQALFFSKTSVVTFGGAYAVLGYVAEHAVHSYAWLDPSEMLDGLGLAETTPGPLILVLEFVGFLGAARHPGTLSPLVAGSLGALVTVWVTFVPCFLWIFVGAPYVEALRKNRALHAALSTITAAAVGVILNLSIWFGLHVLFRKLDELRFGPLTALVPTLSSLDVPSAVLSGLAMLATLRFKVSVLPVLGVSALLGAAYQLLSG